MAQTGEGERESARGGRAAATSAARFNYTLQTHDMSKSYTSYRLRHLLKVSSRAPCRSVSTPSFCCAPKEYSKDARNIRTKSSPKEEYGGCKGWRISESPGARRIFLLAIDSKLRFVMCVDTSLRRTVLRPCILNSIFKLHIMFYCFLDVAADECRFLFELSCSLRLYIYFLFNPLPCNILAQW